MLNEIKDFLAYTTPVQYMAKSKSDTTFLGRFTFDRILKFEGITRILTILARGYMFQTPEPDIDRARLALCAWCSIPETKKSTPQKEWQYGTDFRELHQRFPELVDEHGAGWFYCHAHNVARFVLENSEAVRKGSEKQAQEIQEKFDKRWRDKVMQFQIPIFSSTTKGAWTIRFEDILADALELGPLQNRECIIPDHIQTRITKSVDQKVIPYLSDLVAYYHVHKPEDTVWVILPIANFDAYYGSTYFSKRILPAIPTEILVKEEHYGISRYQLSQDFQF